jgi:hypothetical protein
MERYLWSAIAGRRLKSGIRGIGGCFPAIPYVGLFAATSRDATTLDQKRLTVFRAKGQAERTKAEHAPDKSWNIHHCFRRPGDHIFHNRLLNG